MVNLTYDELARRFLARGIARYGLPTEGPLYDANLSALVDEHLHDFRLRELPEVTRNPGLLHQRPLRILDLGCGPGSFMMRALSEGIDAYGIDLDDGKIELAQAWLRQRSLPAEWLSHLLIASAADMPYANEFFDVVTSYHVLEHVDDLPSVLYEAVRVTKRGGYLELRAPDYRMSYDTHYCMPWPRFLPPKQSVVWAEAMGRPADGVGTFFYVTAPQVIAILQALGCEIVTLTYREHCEGRVSSFNGILDADPIVFRSDADVKALAQELLRLSANNQLPRMYKTCLEFSIAAKKL